MKITKSIFSVLSLFLLILFLVTIGCQTPSGTDRSSTSALSTVDTTPPTPGNSGTITASSITSTSLQLQWNKAEDDSTAQNKLIYQLYTSASDNISTLDDAELNGTLLLDSTEDITSYTITGLTAETTYYFNITVKDLSENKTVYTSTPLTTLEGTPPTPGNSGTITTSSILVNSITLNWTKATDNTSDQADLQYSIWYSMSNNISTVANIKTNGTEYSTYETDINTKSVTGLSEATTYYFNVLVKDEAANEACYTTVSQMTADKTAPVPANSGTITLTRVLGQSLRINWTAANDNATTQANLEYKVVYSGSGNIDSTSDANSASTVQDWTTDADCCVDSGNIFTASSTYYFNVLVRDESGNMQVYTMNSRTMADSSNNYITNPSFSGTTYWQTNWYPSQAGILNLTGKHARTGSYGMYFYTTGVSMTQESYTYLNRSSNDIPWNEGEAGEAWIYIKDTENFSDGNGKIYLTVYFLDENDVELANHEIYVDTISGTDWQILSTTTPVAPAGTTKANIAFGLDKAAGPNVQLKISMDDVHLGVYIP